MKKVAIAVVVVVVVLTATIAFQIRGQEAAESGPPEGSGVVEGEGVDISARLGARIAEIHVTEGDAIAEGAVLMTLECDEPDARLAEATARLAATRAQAEGALAQASAAQSQSRAARASTSASAASIVALEAQRDIARRESARFEAIGAYASSSQRDRAQASAARLDAEAQAARAARAASGRQARAAADGAHAAAAQAESVRQQIAAMEAVVQSAQLGVDECQVRAPRGGTVERVYYEPGELVMPGSVVARVVDPAFVRATFYLPNRDVDAAEVGAAASVSADAYPDRAFDATVRRVGLEAEFTPRNIQTRTDRDRLVFPVEVRIPNGDGLLRSGMPVTVTLGGAS